jgi:predicted molibdopterin-dependent oxidoreductase YjgC
LFDRRPDWNRKNGRKPVTITFDGSPVTAFEGDSVAAALLSSDPGFTRRTPASGAPRAPFCLMGVCLECLVEIDGVADRQACMIPVREGMTVRRQTAVTDPAAEGGSGHGEG